MPHPVTRLLPVLALLLAACQPVPPDLPTTAPLPDVAACGGAPVQALLGQSVDTLPVSGGWGALRVIGPGMAVTQDYSETRLNVGIDADRRITGVWCG